MGKEPIMIITSGYLPSITGMKAQFLEFLDEGMCPCAKDEAAYVRIQVLPGQLGPDASTRFVLPADGVLYDPDIEKGICDHLSQTCAMANLSADPDKIMARVLMAIDEAAERIPGPFPSEPDTAGYGTTMAQWDQAKFQLLNLFKDRHEALKSAANKAERELLHDHGFVYCPKCGGTGLVLRSRSCAEDDPPDPNDPADYEACCMCDGAGVVSGKAD